MAHDPSVPASLDTLHRALGDLLVAEGLITTDQLARALAEQSAWGGRLGQTLLGLGFVDEGDLAAAIARQWALPVAALDQAPPPKGVASVLPLALAERYGVLALDEAPGPDGRQRFACIDPTHNEGIGAVRRHTGVVPLLAVTTPSELDRHLRRVYYGEGPATVPLADPRLNVTRRSVAPAPEAGSPAERLSAIEARLSATEARLARIEDVLAGRSGR